MELDIKERLALLGLLPERGSIVTLRVVQELRSALLFTEAEIAAFGIENDGDRITWKQSPPVEIGIGPAALGVIRDVLKQRDEKGELTLEHLPLYDKLMEKQDWPPKDVDPKA